MEAMVQDTSLPKPLQQTFQLGRAEATKTTNTVLPHHASFDMANLQQTDPTIQEVLVFWSGKQCPNQEERHKFLSQHWHYSDSGTACLIGVDSSIARFLPPWC